MKTFTESENFAVGDSHFGTFVQFCAGENNVAQGEPIVQGTADLYLGLSELHRERGNIEAARERLLKGEEVGEQSALPDWRYRLCRAQARIKASQGDLDGALDLLAEAERLLREFEHITLARVLIAQYKDGRLDRAILEGMALLGRLLDAAEAGNRTGSVIETLLLQALAH